MYLSRKATIVLSMKVMTALHCDPKGIAEAYVMDLMSANERDWFTAHLKRCAACKKEVENTRSYVMAMQMACEQTALDGDFKLHKTVASAPNL